MNRTPGVMAVWNDLVPGHAAQFEAWYQRQHVPERLQVPGFREARRYVAVQGRPRYCAVYWLDGVDVLGSAAYLERLEQPTRWTRRMMPWFRAMARTPCSIVLARGAGLGGSMSWLAMMGEGAQDAPIDLVRAALDGDARHSELIGAQLWQCDRQLAGLDNPEQRLRADRDRTAHWILFLEATTAQAARTLASGMFEALARKVDPRGLLRAPVYRLLSCLHAEDASQPCSDACLDRDYGGA